MNDINPTPAEAAATKVAEVTKRGPIKNPFAKKTVSTDDVAATTKSLKDKVKTGLAVTGAIALGVVAYGAVTKKTSADLTVSASLPALDVSTDTTDN